MTLQTITPAMFQGDVVLNCRIHSRYSNLVSELTAIQTALGTDPTTHDTTMQTAPAALIPGSKQSTRSRFQNDILLNVNWGKAGKLSNAAMATAIGNVLVAPLPPANTVAPVVTGSTTLGSTLTCTTGTWSYAPTYYTYHWQRNGVQIPGQRGSTYVTVAGAGSPDHLAIISCIVRATNAMGQSTVVSNGITML